MTFAARSDEDPTAPGCDPCLIDPSLPECGDDPCEIDPFSPECDPCIEDPSLPQCVGNIYIDILIINEINNKVRQVKSTSTTCTPQQSTVTLGPGSIAAKGVRVLATFDPCVLTGGGAVLNLPDSNNNLKLVAVDLEGGEMHKAVEVNLQRINTITNDQTFYNAQFAKTVTGVSPVTDKVDTIQEINSLILLNDSPEQINFVNDNSMPLNAVLSSN